MATGPRHAIGAAFVASALVACGLDVAGSFTPAGPAADAGATDDVVLPPLDTGTDAPPSGFCATAGPHLFCADFDEGSFPPTGSTAAVASGDAHIDAMVSTSAPYSFFSKIDHATDASARFVVTTPLGGKTGASLTFRVHIDGNGDASGGGPQLFTIQANDSDTYGVRIVVGAGATLEADMTANGGFTHLVTALGAFTVGSWIPVSVIISTQSQVVFIVDGQSTPVLFDIALPDPLLLKLGEYGQNLDAPVIHFDDVTLDLL